MKIMKAYSELNRNKKKNYLNFQKKLSNNLYS